MSDRPSIVAASASLLLGGSTTFLLNLAAGLRECGDDLRVLCLTDRNEHAVDFRRLAVEVGIIDHHRTIYEDRLRAGYEKLAAWQPRAVLACLSAESFEMLRLVPAGVKRFGVIQSHDTGPYELAARYAGWIDGMIGVSSEICDNLRAMPAFRSTPVHAIPYGIDFSKTTATVERRDDEPLRLIYVGRWIEEQKRISRVTALAQSLHFKGSRVHLTLVGSGPDAATVRRELSGLDQVHLEGAVPNDQIPGLLQKHHAYVLLSDYEGLPLALLEAMGQGLVPVVSDLPSGIREAVPDGAGIRVPIGDVDAAIRAVEMLDQEPDRWKAMSQAAFAHVRTRFSARRMAQNYLSLLENTSEPVPIWPSSVRIPPPLGVSPFLFSGWRRSIRRWVKRIRASARGSSTPA